MRREIRNVPVYWSHAPGNGSRHLYLFLAANVPRFSVDKGQQVSRAVDNSKNENVVAFHEIDDPIISENHFSKILTIEFGNDASNMVVLEKCLSGFNDAIDERDCMEDGVAGDKVFDVLKIVPSSQ
jgi:hypothetical protein